MHEDDYEGMDSEMSGDQPANEAGSAEVPGYAKNKIQMTYQLYGRCMWHSDCEPGDGNGIMKGIKREDDGDVFECLHCGKKGFYPVGGAGCITVDEIEA